MTASETDSMIAGRPPVSRTPAPIGATGPFAREHRILDSRDFRRIMRRGRRHAGADLVVFVAPLESRDRRQGDPEKPNEHNGLDSFSRSRLGITVSRKVGNAVCRNRFKRRVRAWFRMRRKEIESALGGAPVDMIVIARPSGGRLGLAELDERLSGLLDLEPAPRA